MDQAEELITGVTDQLIALTIRDYVIAAAALVVTFVAARYAGRWAANAIGHGRNTLASRALSRMVRSAIVLIGLAFALTIVGVQVGPILLFIGVMAFAGFASFHIGLSDYVAGLVLMGKRYFEVDDTVKIAGVWGKIADQDLRAVTLRLIDGGSVIIPNRVVIADEITHVGSRDAWRTDLSVPVAYGIDLDHARQLLTDVARRVDGVLDEPPPLVQGDGFGDYYVTLRVRAFHDPNVAARQHVLDGLTIAAHDALDEAGMSIPFPRTVVELEAESA